MADMRTRFWLTVSRIARALGFDLVSLADIEETVQDGYVIRKVVGRRRYLRRSRG